MDQTKVKISIQLYVRCTQPPTQRNLQRPNYVPNQRKEKESRCRRRFEGLPSLLATVGSSERQKLDLTRSDRCTRLNSYVPICRGARYVFARPLFNSSA